MRLGVREICDVVLRAKSRMKVGNKVFYKNEPVLYFDTLKTSSLEGSSTTVYATGGRGNARLMSWDGEKAVTFSMEDALISPESFMVLSGAGLIEASSSKVIYQHVTERINGNSLGSGDTLVLSQAPYFPKTAGDNFVYVFLVKDGEIISEPIIPDLDGNDLTNKTIMLGTHDCYVTGTATTTDYELTSGWKNTGYDSFLVDYYVAHESGAKEIDITPDSFGGNFYLEASTLFKAEDGIDYPAEFIIPNCRIQSNFTFTMASTGDPSTFNFVMDAFPDYTRFDKTQKVLASIQIIEVDSEGGSADAHRGETPAGTRTWTAAGAAANTHEYYDTTDAEYKTKAHA